MLNVFTTFTLHHHNRLSLTHHLKIDCSLSESKTLHMWTDERAIYIFNRLPGGNNRLLQSGAKTTIQSPSSHSHLWICYECSKLSMTERINEASNFTLLIPRNTHKNPGDISPSTTVPAWGISPTLSCSTSPPLSQTSRAVSHQLVYSFIFVSSSEESGDCIHSSGSSFAEIATFLFD